MKKVICILLSCILAIAPFFSGVVAASQTLITVSSASGNRGDTVSVKVHIASGSGMQACDFELYYDSDVLEIVSAKRGDGLPSSPIINTSILGKIVFSYASTNAMTSSATLLNIQFKIKEGAQYGKSDLSLNCKDFADGNFNPLEFSVKDGYVNVLAPQLEAPYHIEVTKTTDTAISLYWTGVEGATGYNLYLNGALVNSEPVQENVYELVALTPGTDYSVQITTMHYTVESEKSEILSVQTALEAKNVCFFYLVELEDGTTAFEYVYVPLIDGEVEFIPEIPNVPGYVFTGWNQDLTNLEADAMIFAEYSAITPTVTFVDWDGTVLSTQTVEYGASAEAPEVPKRQGYAFLTWDKSFDQVTEDITVTAQYAEIICEHPNVETKDAVVSTCTQKGYSGNVVCSDCGAVLTTGSELPLAEHSYKSVVTDPTYSSQGYTTHTCIVCGDSYVDSYVDCIDENAPQIVVNSSYAVAGKTVEVSISLKNNPGIVSATLQVGYDSDVLTLVKVTDAGLLGTTAHKPELANPYTLVWVNDTATSNFTSDGTIVTLTFEVAEDAALGKYPITVSYDYDNYDVYNVKAEKVKLYSVNGNVEVVDVIIGDVNSDGLVNNLDRLVLTRYLADWDDYGEDSINKIAADVNNDGSVNNLDRMVLTRHLADWEGYEALPCAGQ